MLAFDNAHNCGATGFETDLRLSRDGEIILSHDAGLKRVAGVDRQVAAMNADELCRSFAQSPDGQLRDNFITLRTLLTKYPDKDYILDCKISSRELMVALQSLLTALQFHSQLWFLTWSEEADRCVAEFFPDSPLFPRQASTWRWGLSGLVGLASLAEPPNHILSLPSYFLGIPVFTSNRIRSISERGKQFMGYLVNTRRDYERCCQAGVKQVLTDRPDLISTLIRG